MKSIFKLIAFFTNFLFGLSYISIGDYNKLNPDGCGVSRLSFEETENCTFEWHKQVIPSMETGKTKWMSKAPWMAYLQSFNETNGIMSNCSGALIADQWILTAAQCVYGAKFVQINLGSSSGRIAPQFGFNHTANEIHIHPNYATDPRHDLALLKIMETQVPIESGINNICLPKKCSNSSLNPNIVPTYEYVNNAVWVKESPSLKIAYWIILNKDVQKCDQSLAQFKKIDEINACKSIPGAPIWQYHSGRAVIVAVLISGIKEDSCDQNKHYLISGARVDTEIDWIDSVINPKEKPYKDLYLVNTDSCRIIRWPTWDPEILPYYKEVWNYNKKIDCGEPLDIIIERTNLTGIILKNPFNKNINCYVKRVERDCDDSTICYSNIEPDLNINDVNYQGALHKTVKIICEGESNIEKFINLIHMSPVKDYIIRRNLTDPKLPSILILGIDSISLMNFERHLPLTKEFITKHNFYTMYGYNKVGLNKFSNLIPLLTGHYVEEIWNIYGYKFEAWPLIWHAFYGKKGYFTYYMEDAAEMHTFNHFTDPKYKKSGFSRDPTNYYFRSYFLGLKDKVKGNCYLDEPVIKVMNDYLYEFIKVAKKLNNTYWALHWISRIAHDHFNDAGLADRYVVDLLKRLFNENLINNTFIFFLSDHGVLEAENQYLFSNKFESRKPFCHIWVPEKWRNENISLNQHRLTTPFDVHATMYHILEGKPYNNSPSWFYNKGKSLLWEIPKDRSCESIPIAEHWCLCQDIIPINESLINSISEFVIKELNSIISQESQKCVELSFGKTISTFELRMKDKVLRFKECRLTPDMCINDDTVYYSETSMEAPNKHFSITFEVKPSNALFGATVNYNTKSGDMFIIGIKRNNSYGNQSHCISNPDLKEYCFCKDLQK